MRIDIDYEQKFAELYTGIVYVLTFQNPLISALVVIWLGLTALHFYKLKTSKKYAEKASKMYEFKLFGFIPTQYPSIRDGLIFMAFGVALFIALLWIFLET